MIANYGYRVGASQSISLAKRVKDALHGERFTLAFAGFGLATAAWTAAIAIEPGLLPLVAVPVLLAARYGDRRLAGIAVAVTAVFATWFGRLPNLELGVWHAVLFAIALGGLYFLAERLVVRAPKSDPIARFLRAATLANRKGSEIVFECEGLTDVAAVYGAAARDHVVDLLRRSIRQFAPRETSAQQTPGGEFHVFLPNVGFAAATKVGDQVRNAFESQVFDAGYGASIQLRSNSASRSS